jgi:L-ascorbate metabolism protein UlaG (beta-lactamase superfamily)
MLEITWLGHGTFHFRLDSGEVVVLDPWIGGNPAYPTSYSISRLDLMLLTHGHGDHTHDAVLLAKKFQPQVVAAFETCLWLESKGVRNTSPMNKGGSQQAGPFSVTMTNAVHSCGIQDGERIVYGGEAAGYVIQLPDKRSLYFAGDTAVFSDMRLIADLYNPSLAFLPIGDLYTMGPREAAEACRMLRVQQVIPMHYGTFPALNGRPAELASLIKDIPGTKVWTLEPGRPVEW